ncbi:hypothetical protein AAK894_04590 [Lachnospiraceae bacterium 46-61]|jgi:hypothetical protein
MSKIEVRKQNFYDIKLISYILLIGLITFAVGLLGKEKTTFRCNHCGYIIAE